MYISCHSSHARYIVQPEKNKRNEVEKIASTKKCSNKEEEHRKWSQIKSNQRTNLSKLLAVECVMAKQTIRMV